MSIVKTLLLVVIALGAAIPGLGGIGRLIDPLGNLQTIPIEVPGDVHSALLAAGIIPDPYFGTNEVLTTWVGDHDWIIEYDMVLDESDCVKKRAILRLEDVDTLADLYLNGERIGSTHNRFRRWDFDVSGKVRPGRNVLRAVFKNVIEAKEREARRYDHSYWVHGPVMKNLNLIRKPFCHGGWDWGPEILNIGFMQEPKLITTDGIVVDYVYARQNFSDDMSRVDVDFTIEYSKPDGSIGITKERRTVEHPKLWWPRGMGEAVMTDFTLNIDGIEIRKSLGLRKIELLTEKDSDGSSMAFAVNGRRVFVKGADFIPCDALESRQTPDRYRELIEAAASANMNMLRVWGGGQYERDCFYTLCDRLGIMVWQDFMFACACYPGTDEFLIEIDKEARHQIRRLMDHPCIAVWCGDNECGIGHARWYRDEIKSEDERKILADEYRRRLSILRSACESIDPSRCFWMSSPCRGGEVDPVLGGTSDNEGDEHNWDIWHGDQDFEQYRKRVPRFCSEFGYQSLSSPSVAKTYLSAGPIDLNGLEFAHHQKDYGGNKRIEKMVGRYFEVPDDPVDFMWISQVQQGLAIKTAIECWRSSQPHCMGTLIWQLNDNWPVASWSSVEYGGRWKVVHHLARKFYAPVTVQAVPVGDRLEIRGVSERGLRKGRLEVLTYDFSGKVVEAIRQDVEILEGASILLSKLITDWGDEEARKNKFLYLTFNDGEYSYVNDYLFARPKDCKMRSAKVRVEDGCLVTDVPAFFVITENPSAEEGNCHVLLPERPIPTCSRPIYWYNRPAKRLEAPWAKFTDGLLTKIRPEGWLLEACATQQKGLTGHPEALSYPYDSCLWAGIIARQGEHGDGWWRYEQTAYYTDGLLRLGYALGDEQLVAKGSLGIDYTLNHVSPEGFLGNPCLWDKENYNPEPGYEMWPMAVFFRAMKAKFDATQDIRIPIALARYYLLNSTDVLSQERNVMNVEGILWAYGKTRDPRLLDLAEGGWRNAHAVGSASCDFGPKICEDDKPIYLHGVTYSEEIKVPLLLWAYTGNENYRKQAVNAERKLVRDHMLPDGCPSSTEQTRGNAVCWGHETCVITDYTWSLGYFLEATGEAEYGDRIERCVFNAGFGAVTKDFKALQYFSNLNQFVATSSSNPNPYRSGTTWAQYRPTHETECCAGNVHRFLPNYISRMWMKDANGHPVAALYGPCSVDYGYVRIKEQTLYPFDGKIRFLFNMKTPKKFGFTYRIPGWCRTHPNCGKFVTVNREFRDGDVIDLDFHMETVFEKLPRRRYVCKDFASKETFVIEGSDNSQGTVVARGPILFAHSIEAHSKEDCVNHANLRGKKSANSDFKCWDMTPRGKYGYALANHETRLELNAQGDAWNPSCPVVSLSVNARDVKWGLTDEHFTADLPDQIEVSSQTNEVIKLVPYGATCLRQSVFPEME